MAAPALEFSSADPFIGRARSQNHLHHTHAEQDGDTDFRAAVYLDIPQQHYREETENPVAGSAGATVGDSSVGHYRGVYARALGRPLDLPPEVRRRETLDHRDDD